MRIGPELAVIDFPETEITTTAELDKDAQEIATAVVSIPEGASAIIVGFQAMSVETRGRTLRLLVLSETRSFGWFGVYELPPGYIAPGNASTPDLPVEAGIQRITVAGYLTPDDENDAAATIGEGQIAVTLVG